MNSPVTDISTNPAAPAKQGVWERSRPLLATFGLVFVFVPFMAKREEWYPFSHFPMYSNLADIWTLSMTDEKGEIISAQRNFKGRPNSIRKLTTSRLRQVQKEWGIASTLDLTPEAWAEAGKRTLTWLVQTHEPQGPAAEAKSLKLYRDVYALENGKAEKKKILICEFPMPTKAQATTETK